MSKNEQNRPKIKYLAMTRGGSVNLSGWERETTYSSGRVGRYMSFTLQKSYYDEESKAWKNTNKYSYRDLEKARDVIQRALEEHTGFDGHKDTELSVCGSPDEAKKWHHQGRSKGGVACGSC